MPQPDHRFGVLQMLDDKLTIFGGQDRVTYEVLNKVTTYDNDTNSWYTYYPDMLNKRFKPGVITYQNYVMVMGGWNSPNIIYDNIEVMNYNRELEWKVISVHLPVPMWAFKPTMSGNNITIVGYDGDRGRYTTHYQISVQEIITSFDQPPSADANSNEWKELSYPLHYNTTTIPYSDPPVIVGGDDIEDAVTSDVTAYEKNKDLWRQVDKLTSNKKNLGVALLKNNTIIIVGGTTGGAGVEEYKASSLTTVEIGNIVPNQQL